MVNRDILEDRLLALNNYVGKLKQWQKYSLADLEDEEKLWAVEHGLQLAIECVLDIGNHIVADANLGRPKDYKDIILFLGREGIIPEKLVNKLAPAAGFRNILVHEYQKVDTRQVYKSLQEDLDDLLAFAKTITEYIERKEED